MTPIWLSGAATSSKVVVHKLDGVTSSTNIKIKCATVQTDAQPDEAINMLV